MPKGYVCSNCGAPVSPAQNRCHQCGAEIDWQKAVGRVSYISYLPAARARRRARRRAVIAGILLIFILAATAYWGWTNDWTQIRWQTWLGPNAYQSYQQAARHLREGQLGPARDDFNRMIPLRGKQTATPSPTLFPTPTPTVLLAQPPVIIPTSTQRPAATPSPASAATPQPEANQAQALVKAAKNLSEQTPCQAADLLQQALQSADSVEIEDLRQEMQARCQQLTVTPPIQLNTLSPTPPVQRIAYTIYDIASGLYSLPTWTLGEHLAGPTLAQWAMQPAFGPQGAIAYRSLHPDSRGIVIRHSDGSTRRITKGPDDQWPRWGPGAQQLLFTSARRNPDGSPHIYLVDIASRSVEDLSPGLHADWSRTGRIVFSGCDAGGEACGLRLLDSTTLQRTRLTSAPDDSHPVWSPDGRYVAFMSSSRTASWDIFILDVQTGAITPAAPHPAEDGLPAWSPDGRSIAFISDRSGDWAVYLWRLDDASVARLFPVSQTLPNWQQAGLDWGF